MDKTWWVLNGTSEFFPQEKKNWWYECLKEMMHIFIYCPESFYSSLFLPCNVTRQNILIDIVSIELKHDHQFFFTCSTILHHIFSSNLPINTWITEMSQEAQSNFILKLAIETIIWSATKSSYQKKKTNKKKNPKKSFLI